MKKFLVRLACVAALGFAATWGYGVFRAGLDARSGGPSPDVEPEGEVQRVVHKIMRSGYNWYFNNFSKVGNREGAVADELTP